MFSRLNRQQQWLAHTLMVLCLFALLLAQTLGQQHRLSHINTVVGQVYTLASDGADLKLQRWDGSSETNLHSCVLLDASSLCDAVLHVPLRLFHTPAPDTLFIQHANLTRVAQVWFAFLSRAPPN